ALLSSRLQAPLPPDCVYFGEVSLSGAIRPVSHAPARLKEAQKLGFGQAIVPAAGEAAPGATGIGQLIELVSKVAARASRREDRDEDA
ncbi:MAG TPA: DNA repair protein RadA, partial [Bauldia sp.]|nr:DNA repair protein RadA [Bauldia sp.]